MVSSEHVAKTQHVVQMRRGAVGVKVEAMLKLKGPAFSKGH